MKKKDLQYLLAFAEEMGLMKAPFTKVFLEACANVQDGTQYWDCTTDEYVEFYLHTRESNREQNSCLPEISEKEVILFLMHDYADKEKEVKSYIEELASEYDIYPSEIPTCERVRLYLLHQKTGRYIW